MILYRDTIVSCVLVVVCIFIVIIILWGSAEKTQIKLHSSIMWWLFNNMYFRYVLRVCHYDCWEFIFCILMLDNCLAFELYTVGDILSIFLIYLIEVLFISVRFTIVLIFVSIVRWRESLWDQNSCVISGVLQKCEKQLIAVFDECNWNSVREQFHFSTFSVVFKERIEDVTPHIAFAPRDRLWCSFVGVFLLV